MGRKARLLERIISGQLDIGTFSGKDMENVVHGAIEEINERTVRILIGLCMERGWKEQGVAAAKAVVTYPEIEERETDGRVENAVKLLSFYAASGQKAKGMESRLATEAIGELLEHSEPSVVRATLDNLSSRPNLEIYKQVCRLLLRDDEGLQKEAMKWLELKSGEIAFTGKEGEELPEEEADFIAKTCIALEKTKSEIDASGKKRATGINTRLNILIGLSFNHVVRRRYLQQSAAARRESEGANRRDEGVAWQVYGAYETHLLEDLGGIILPPIAKKLQSLKRLGHIGENMDRNVLVCAIDTIRRVGMNVQYRKKALETLERTSIHPKAPEDVKEKARRAAQELRASTRTSLIPDIMTNRKAKLGGTPKPKGEPTRPMKIKRKSPERP
ncbi:MAG: hypothetical protein ACLFUZ_05395 [Candidatus Micrarchaeia archaeon]